MAKGSRGGQAKPSSRPAAAASAASSSAAPSSRRASPAAPPPKPQPAAPEYDDDDFEDYDDDFEEPEELMMNQPPAMPKASRSNPTQLAASIPARKKVFEPALRDLDAITDAVKQENAGTKQRAEALREGAVAEAKTQRSSSKPAAKQAGGAKQSKQAKYGGGGGASGAGFLGSSLSSMDPRVRRARSVREQITLVCERYSAFDQPPLTDHQIYRLRLRGAAPPQREVSCSTQDETSQVESQTDDVATCDREMQFALGDDDTDFENLIAKIAATNKERRASFRKADSKNDDDDDDDDDPKGTREQEPPEANEEEEIIVSTQRLPEFVRNVAPVLEMLLEETAERESSVKDSRGDGFFAGGDWLKLEGSKFLPPTTRVLFSSARASMLVAVHGGGNEEEKTEAPSLLGDEEVRLSVWESRSWSEGPVALLCGGGEPSCACLAPCNGFVVCAGTKTGAVLVWDLRERVTEESRSAAFSTAAVGIVAGGQSHASEVVALAPLGDSSVDENSSTFQLASLDDRGLVALWLLVEDKAEDDASASLSRTAAALVDGQHGAALTATDETFLGLRSGAGLRLQCTRTLHVWTAVPSSLFSAPNKSKKISSMVLSSDGDEEEVVKSKTASVEELVARVGVGPGATSAFLASPADPNEFIVALSDGLVVRCSRLGIAKQPRVFHASAGALRRAILPVTAKEETKGEDLPPPPPPRSRVTVMQFSPFASDVFLVGQEDGALRLHRTTHAAPLLTWPCCSGGFKTTPVADLQWSPYRPSVFFVVYANGDLHLFDLLKDDARPTKSTTLPKKGAGTRPSIALSSARAASSHKSIAVSFGGGVYTRTLSEAATAAQPDELAAFNAILDVAVC